MELESIRLRGFRNYFELDAAFVPGVNLILGDNALDQAPGSVRVGGFLVDMWKVFEDFVTAALARALEARTLRSSLDDARVLCPDARSCRGPAGDRGRRHRSDRVWRAVRGDDGPDDVRNARWPRPLTRHYTLLGSNRLSIEPTVLLQSSGDRKTCVK